jgi:hypothetical protein
VGGLQAEYHRATDASKGAAAGSSPGDSLQQRVDELVKERGALKQQLEEAQQERKRAEVDRDALKSQAKVGRRRVGPEAPEFPARTPARRGPQLARAARPRAGAG